MFRLVVIVGRINNVLSPWNGGVVGPTNKARLALLVHYRIFAPKDLPGGHAVAFFPQLDQPTDFLVTIGQDSTQDWSSIIVEFTDQLWNGRMLPFAPKPQIVVEEFVRAHQFAVDRCFSEGCICLAGIVEIEEHLITLDILSPNHGKVFLIRL